MACGVLVGCGSGSASTSNSSNPGGSYTLKLGSDQGSTTYSYQGDLRFAADLKSLTHGHVTVQLFPGSSLGTESSMVTGLEQGSLDLGDLCTCNLSGELTVLGLFDLPYLVLTQQQAVALTKSSAMNGVKSKLAASGLTVLGIKPIGPIGLEATKAATDPSEIQGMKLRTVTNPVTTAFFKKLGAIVTPLPPTQVYSALQQGVVNGTTASLPAIVGDKWYEPAKVYSEIDETFLYQLLVASTVALHRLPKPYQADIAKASASEVAWSNAGAAKVISGLLQTQCHLACGDLGGVSLRDARTESRQDHIVWATMAWWRAGG